MFEERLLKKQKNHFAVFGKLLNMLRIQA